MRVIAQATWLALIASALALSAAARAEPVDALYASAAAHYRAGQWQDACDDFEALLELPIDQSTKLYAHFYYGEALAQLGRYADAREQFTRLLEMDNDHRFAGQALFRRAEAGYLSGDSAAAKADLSTFIQRYADDDLSAYALFYRAHLEETVGDSQAARKSFAEAAERFARKVEDGATQTTEAPATRLEAAASLAVCYARLGRISDGEDALAIAQSIGQKSATLDRASVELAEAAYASGDYETAAKHFETLANSATDDELACRGFSGLGWCRFKRGEWEAAAEVFDQLVARFPDDPTAAEACLMRGRALEHEERFDEALTAYQHVIEREPRGKHRAEALWGAARVHDQLNETAEAVDEYRQLVDEYPKFSELDAVIYRLAWLEHTAGNADEARRLWQRIRHDYGASKLAADATLRLAEDALAHRQFDEASELLSEITPPESPAEVRPHAFALTARVAMAQGRWNDVEMPLTSLDELLAEMPDEKLAHSAAYWRAEAAFRLGKYAEAAERLHGLLDSPEIREQPWAGTATLRLAQALAQLKKWPESREVAQSISRDYPEFEEQYEADYVMGRALVAEAQLDDARTMFAKVVAAEQAAESETAVMAQFMIAETYFHQQDFAAALAEYRKASDDNRFPRWQAAALLQAGKCHEALGEWTAAGSAYEQVIRGFSDSPLAGEARSRATNAQTHARAAAALKK